MTADPSHPASSSLLDRQSSGGDTARKGTTFQDNYLLSNLPLWLGHHAFAALTHESMGDIEVKYFDAMAGEVIDFYEVKDHQIIPSEFWREIDRFQTLRRDAPQHYRRFTLVGRTFSQEAEPIINALDRIRGPLDFYGRHSSILEKSREEFYALVADKGHSRKDADLLLDHVSATCASPEGAEALFMQRTTDELKLVTVNLGSLKAAFNEIHTLLQNRRNTTIPRESLEIILARRVGADSLFRDVRIQTLTSNIKPDPRAILMLWEGYFEQTDSGYPPEASWQETIVGQLARTKKWIDHTRSQRRINLDGSRRTSVIMALAATFSSVSGYTIEMNHRGAIWATDQRPSDATPEPSLRIATTGTKGESAILDIGICTDISDAVAQHLRNSRLGDHPRLSIYHHQPILSPEMGNLLASRCKQELQNMLTTSHANRVHLFYAGPSHFALQLIHRFNATAHIQCYEWTSRRTYVPTVTLFDADRNI